LYLYDMVRLHKIIAFGHTMTEILVGLIAGIILTLVIYYFVGRKNGFKNYKKEQLDKNTNTTI